MDSTARTRRHPIFYLVDLYFLHIAVLAFATPRLRARIYMGDVEQPHFPGCVAQQVDMHWSSAKGTIDCADGRPWGWLIEYVGNALGSGSPSAFMDGTDFFFAALILYAFGHVIYAVGRLILVGQRRHFEKASDTEAT